MTPRHDTISDATHAKPTQEELWQRVQAGDELAFAEIHAQQSGRLLVWLQTRCRHPLSPNDILQEVWTKAWRSRSQFGVGKGDNLRAWLFRIAGNVITDHIRSVSRRPLSSLDPTYDVSAARPDPHLDEDEQRAFRECLDQVGGKWAEVLRWRLDDCSNDEIARKMNITIGTVYRYASEAATKIRQCVENKQR